MTDLEKVQKTLSDVFDYLNNKNDNEVSKRLLTEVGDAHRIVENLTIHGVVVSLPKFKKGQTLKRQSNHTNDFTVIKVKFINKLKSDYRYLSENNVWYSEKELLAY